MNPPADRSTGGPAPEAAPPRRTRSRSAGTGAGRAAGRPEGARAGRHVRRPEGPLRAAGAPPSAAGIPADRGRSGRSTPSGRPATGPAPDGRSTGGHPADTTGLRPVPTEEVSDER